MMRKNKSSLTVKIFLITMALLVAACSISVLCMAKYIPETYGSQLSERLQNEARKLAQELGECTSLEDCYTLVDSFSLEMDARVSINDQEGYLIYPEAGGKIDMSNDTVAVMKDEDEHSQAVEDELLSEIMFPFTIKSTGEGYILEVHGKSSPINQAASAIQETLPTILIGIFILSILCSFFYSHYITNPIIEISKVSERMAELDFSMKSDLKRNDEVGVLSESLNVLSGNLEKTLHELESEIRKEKELEKKQRNFFASASHDLKTPIAILIGHLNGILDGVGDYKNAKPYIERSIAIAEQMNQLVQSLLFIAYVENGTVAPVFEKSDFAELVRRSVGEMSCLIEDKGQQLSVDIPDRAICWFDSGMMKRVIKNLIENAVKYSPVKESIAISMSQDRNADITFEIENTGVTIPNDSLPNLFEPFYRVDASRSRENGGNGLGMYIIKTLLENHEASYGICNTDNGVKFQFCLIASKIHRKSI